MTVATFNLGDMWLANDGDLFAFGHTLDQVTTAISNPNSAEYESLVVLFSADEWKILAAYAQSIDRIVPSEEFASNVTFEGEEGPRVGEAVTTDRMVTPAVMDPRNAKYAVLSPVGRKYGTWAIMRQSTRTDTNWDIMMPDVGSSETAKRIVAILNAQGADVGPKLVARGL